MQAAALATMEELEAIVFGGNPGRAYVRSHLQRRRYQRRRFVSVRSRQGQQDQQQEQQQGQQQHQAESRRDRAAAEFSYGSMLDKLKGVWLQERKELERHMHAALHDSRECALCGQHYLGTQAAVKLRKLRWAPFVGGPGMLAHTGAVAELPHNRKYMRYRYVTSTTLGEKVVAEGSVSDLLHTWIAGSGEVGLGCHA